MVAAVTWAVWVAWAVWACNQRKLIQHSNCCLMKAPQCGAFFLGLRCLSPLVFMARLAALVPKPLAVSVSPALMETAWAASMMCTEASIALRRIEYLALGVMFQQGSS
jgi:hypothetical protein